MRLPASLAGVLFSAAAVGVFSGSGCTTPIPKPAGRRGPPGA